MSNVIPGVPHSPIGWPTIEERFDEDTMSRRFDMTPKGFKSRESSCSRMSKRNAKIESLESFPDLVDKFPISLAMSSLTDKVHDISLQGFLLKGSLPKPSLRMLTCIGKLTIHIILRHSDVDNKGIVMPIIMWVSVRKVNTVSKNGKADFGRKCGKVKRGQTSNANFRGKSAVFDIPYLGGKSNVIERTKESWRKPVARTYKEFPFEILKEVVNLLVAGRKLPNIREKRHNKDIGSQDVVEETSTEVLPSLNSVGSFLNGVLELSF